MPFDRTKYETVGSLDRLDAWIAEASETGRVAIDTETTGSDPMQADLVGVSLALAPGRAAYVPLGHRIGATICSAAVSSPARFRRSEALARLKPLLEDAAVLKIAQNLKYDAHRARPPRHRARALRRHHADLLRARRRPGRLAASTALAEQLLGHAPDAAFKDLAGTGKAQVTLRSGRARHARREYSAEDADVAMRLWTALKPRLVAEHMVNVYETLERPLVPVLARMEARGIKVDRQILSRLSGEFAQKLGGLEDEIYELAGENFNIGSPKQLGDILFGKFGLPGGKKTKTGAWSTGADVLDELAANGNDARRPHPRLAAAVQAEVDLHRPRCPATSTPRPAASTRPMRSPRPPPAGCRRPIRTCRTSRSAPRTAGASAPPSSPRRA